MHFIELTCEYPIMCPLESMRLKFRIAPCVLGLSNWPSAYI